MSDDGPLAPSRSYYLYTAAEMEEITDQIIAVLDGLTAAYRGMGNGTQLRFLLVSVLWLVTVGSRLGGWPSSGQSMCNSYR